MTNNKDTLYSMNLNDGRIVFRNEQVDKQINYYPVPHDVAVMVDRKELDWKKVKEACEKKMKENGELDIQEYLQKLKLLNVRKTKVDFAEDESKVEDRSDEMITLADVVPPETKKGKAKAEEKPKATEEVTAGVTVNI